MLRLSLRRILVRYLFFEIRRSARHRNPIPFLPYPSICLRRRPLYCGSVPRICSRHTGIVFLRLDLPRESADDPDMEINYLAFDRSIPLSYSAYHRRSPPVFFDTSIFIVNYLYQFYYPSHFSSPRPHAQHCG